MIKHQTSEASGKRQARAKRVQIPIKPLVMHCAARRSSLDTRRHLLGEVVQSLVADLERPLQLHDTRVLRSVKVNGDDVHARAMCHKHPQARSSLLC